MSHLQSGPPGGAGISATTTNTFPILHGNEDFQPWFQSLSKHVDSRYESIGQNLFSDLKIVLDHQHPGGNEPSETDQRTNPVTGASVVGSLKYSRVPPPEGDVVLSIFDQPLTDSSQLKLDRDISSHKSLVKNHKDEVKALRALDDALLTFITEHIDENLLHTIETHADWATFKGLDRNNFYRSKTFLHVTTAVCSTGNKKLIIHNFIRSAINPQGDKTFTAWLSKHNGDWQTAIKALESKQFPGHVSIEFLEFAFITNNLSDNPANNTAQNNYYIKYGESVTNPRHLIAELVSTNVSLADPKADPTSRQGSALAAAAALAATSPAHWGKRDPLRSDHCTSCVTLTKNQEKIVDGIMRKGPFYFYNHTTSNCTRQKRADAAKNAKTTAKALLATGPLPATSAPPAAAAALPSDTQLQIAIHSVLNRMCSDADALSLLSNSSTQQL